MFNYTTVKNKDCFVVLFEGDLDIDVTEVVEDELIPLLIEKEEVELNLKGVPFVDSSGIGLLIKLVQALQDKGVKIFIADVREEVANIFELLQLSDILGEEVIK